MTDDREKSMLIHTGIDEPQDGSCESCGSTKPMWSLRAWGETTCCPDRRMVSAERWRARAIAAVEMTDDLFKKLGAIEVDQADLKIQIDTLVKIANEREGNLARACAERDSYKRLSEAFCLVIEDVLPVLELLEARFGDAVIARAQADAAKGETANG